MFVFDQRINIIMELIHVYVQLCQILSEEKQPFINLQKCVDKTSFKILKGNYKQYRYIEDR
jgi:hypothetical protein